MRGAKKYDQAWIDETVEAGVGGCGWARPKPRPAAIDAGGNAAPSAPKKKPGFVQRVKDHIGIWPPVTAVPPAPPDAPAPLVLDAPAVPVPPPDPLDDLLGGR